MLATVERSRLTPAALAFRIGHGAIAAAFLTAIAYVWWCAVTGRRDRRLRLAVVALIGEGAFVAANGGDCPLGPLQVRLGDPVPLFELVLSPTAARRAVPRRRPLAARAPSGRRSRIGRIGRARGGGELGGRGEVSGVNGTDRSAQA
jgi:hypothetical protein